jgi:chemotaxis protein methyltransferase CheR
VSPVSPDPAILDGVLADWAIRRLGFDRRALRLERLRQVAEREAERLGWAGFERALAGGEPGVDAVMVAAATVGETYFFRQHEHFDLLTQLNFRGSPGKPLMAWSAACATGEEAYSLAIALRQQQGLEAPALQVWGTDINEAALVSARAAAYGRWSFRASSQEGSPEDPVDALARTEKLIQEVLSPQTQACVRFARHNLLEPPVFDGGKGGRFHVIFCRNALVYFQADAAAVALVHLVQALVPGGWLVLGNMDISATPAGTRRVGSAQLCVFERLTEEVEAEAAPAPSIAKEALSTLRQRSASSKPAVKMPEPVAAYDLDQAMDWHRAVMAQLESGDEGAALLELQALVEAFPAYLPGWFEHGLALNRRGQKALAADSMRQTLILARHLDLSEPVPGPELLSLDFYVSNAAAFLQSLGDEHP